MPLIYNPESLGTLGNVGVKVLKNNTLIQSKKVQNNCTSQGLMYILYSLLQEVSPIVTNFGITTYDPVTQEYIDHIFSVTATDENNRGQLIRDLVITEDEYKARFKFYLQSNQLNGEDLREIHLYAKDRNGNLFKMFTATHIGGSGGWIRKDDTLTVSYEWLVGLRNEYESIQD